MSNAFRIAYDVHFEERKQNTAIIGEKMTALTCLFCFCLPCSLAL